MPNPKAIVAAVLAKADIALNGVNPWDLQVHDDRVYQRILAQGSLGLGEAYLDGWWDAVSLDQLFTRILAARLESAIPRNLKMAMASLQARWLNKQNKTRAFAVGEQHYDLGNDLYQTMLDQRLTYTCGYWERATTLNEAQEAKLDLVCRKLRLQPGQRVLDIGCGWGSWLKFAAKHYGVTGVGITVSKEQVGLAKQLCQGLPVEIRLQDYRDLNESFDHIVSLGMFEHVGWKNYATYLATVRRCLKDSGLFLLHTIGGNSSTHETDAWIEKYIFPNSMLPSIAQIGQAIEQRFVMEDWHNFGADYDKTLMAWFQNFEAGWQQLQKNYGERFYRMWKYYLLSCAGSFRSRRNQLWQVVLSKHGVPGGYQRI